MIIDANVLLYAVNPEAAHHKPALTWLERAFNGPTRVGLPWQSTMAFFRIATHPRIFPTPMNAETAWSFIEDWLAADNSWIPTPTTRHREVVRRLLLDGDITGNLAPDADLAALAIEYGVNVCSFDSDFARFPEAGWVNPLTDAGNG